MARFRVFGWNVTAALRRCPLREEFRWGAKAWPRDKGFCFASQLSRDAAPTGRSSRSRVIPHRGPKDPIESTVGLRIFEWETTKLKTIEFCGPCYK